MNMQSSFYMMICSPVADQVLRKLIEVPFESYLCLRDEKLIVVLTDLIWKWKGNKLISCPTCKVDTKVLQFLHDIVTFIIRSILQSYCKTVLL